MQSLDALTLKHLARELDEGLRGAKINKVQQPSRQEFLLTLWGSALPGKFYVNLSPESAVAVPVTETDFVFRNLSKPTSFCMLLRKHLQGAKILEVHTLPGERVLNLVFDHHNELGNRVRLVLSLELMGKYTNMILYDAVQNVILGATHSVTEEMSRFREVATGLPYAPPPRPQDRRLFSEVTEREFVDLVAKSDDVPLTEILGKHFWGFGPALLSDIALGITDPAHLYRRLLDLEMGNTVSPALHEGGKRFTVYLSADSPTDMPKGWHPQPSVLEMVQTYFTTQIRHSRVQSGQRELSQCLRAQLKKLSKREEEMTPVSAEEISDLQKRGDLLFAELSIGQLPESPAALKGPKILTVTDYETDAPLKIELDPTLGWSENAQRYYRRAKKAKSKQAVCREMMERLQSEKAYIEELLLLVAQAGTLAELSALQEDLAAAGLVKQRESKPGKEDKEPSGLLKLVSSDGMELWVGKSGQANGMLVGKLAKPEDLWLHVHQMPGSHVLVKTDRRPVPDQTLLEAANLAVFYSAGRQSANVPVLYTLSRYVRKIPNSYPGHVTYREEQTVFITCDPQIIEGLRPA